MHLLSGHLGRRMHSRERRQPATRSRNRQRDGDAAKASSGRAYTFRRSHISAAFAMIVLMTFLACDLSSAFGPETVPASRLSFIHLLHFTGFSRTLSGGASFKALSS